MRKLFALTALSATALLAGCVTTSPHGGFMSGAGILSTAGEKQPVSAPTLRIKVPSDEAVFRSQAQAVVADLVIPNFSVTRIPDASYSRVFIESKTTENFLVHVRNDNGVAGSGIRFGVDYQVTERGQGAYDVLLTPTHKVPYQQGLIGKFPIPDFSDAALSDYLKSFTLYYKFEVDTPYNSDAVMANFLRLAKVQPNVRGTADPVTGKIFHQYFTTQYKNKSANYTVQVFPYRQGSKAVIHMELPAVETQPNEVDFTVIIRDLKATLEKIANA